MKIHAGLLAVLAILLAGCLPVRPRYNPPQITQLQARAIQTRVFESIDKKTAVKTVLNVLQDEGFIVHYGDMELGLLNASKELVERSPNDFSGVFNDSTANNNALENAVSSIEATANISEYGKKIKVRLNFQRKVTGTIDNSVASLPDFPGFLFFTDAREKTVEVNTINDPKYYQEFFVKVDKGLFIQKQGL